MAKGIRHHGKGWQAYIRLGGRLYTKQFPRTATVAAMQDWRAEMRRAHRWKVRAEPAAKLLTFQEDADRYLAAVREMPSYADRERDILLWVSVFADRYRSTIQPAEIAAQLHAWRKTCAASTVNHRRTALMHLWTVLDEKHQPNPVKAVPRFPEPDPEPRALPYRDLLAVLEEMPDSKTKMRLCVMLWTGWPQKQLARLEPGDVDLANGVAYVRKRRKGKGVVGRMLPLLPQAVAALKAFDRWDCWGEFSHHSMYKSFRLACEKLITRDPNRWGHLRGVRPYDLRHSFGTAVALYTKDDRAVQTLMLHSRPEQTHRYTMAAVDPRVATALATLGNFLPGTVAKQSRKPSPNGNGRRGNTKKTRMRP